MATKKLPASHHARSSRLLELHAEVGTPEPYPIPDLETGETLFVIQPLTRSRKKQLNAAEMQIYVLNDLLSGWLKRATAPEPVAPTTPEPTLAEDPTPEQFAEHEVALAEWSAAQTQWAAAHAAWTQAQDSAESEIEAFNRKIEDARDDAERAFFGDVYDKVIEYFEDKPLLWDKFVPDIRAQFLPPAPVDGPHAETAGKAPESST